MGSTVVDCSDYFENLGATFRAEMGLYIRSDMKCVVMLFRLGQLKSDPIYAQ